MGLTKKQISKYLKHTIEKEMSCVSWIYDDGVDGIGYNDFYNGRPQYVICCNSLMVNMGLYYRQGESGGGGGGGGGNTDTFA